MAETTTTKEEGSAAAIEVRRTPGGGKKQLQKNICRHVTFRATDHPRFRNTEDHKDVRTSMYNQTATLLWRNSVSQSSHLLASLITFRATATEHSKQPFHKRLHPWCRCCFLQHCCRACLSSTPRSDLASPIALSATVTEHGSDHHFMRRLMVLQQSKLFANKLTSTLHYYRAW